MSRRKHPAWLDDKIVVTKGSKQIYIDKLLDVLSNLESAGYRLSESKFEIFETEIEGMGHEIDQNGVQPLQDKLLAIKELKEPKKRKRTEVFPGSNTELV